MVERRPSLGNAGILKREVDRCAEEWSNSYKVP